MNLPENNGIKTILPGQMIGIIGGGQLGRMMAIAAREMGYKIAVLDPTPNCPTAQVADEHIVANYDDIEAVKQLTTISDVVTYEFENVDLEAATYIEGKGKLPQGASSLEVTQNREKEKELLKQLGLPIPTFSIVHDGDACRDALEDFPLPAVIKTCQGGYDGKGQFKIEDTSDVEDVAKFVDESGTCMIEEWVLFEKEISVVFTRSQNGDMSFFPIPENEHKEQILHRSTVPAEINDVVSSQAIAVATIIANKMSVVGTFAIEMFVHQDGIYINEMAPRPHNSGHYTIEACNISQFASHIRAICGLPLIDVQLLKPAVMINVLGEDMEDALQFLQRSKDGFVHLYGKETVKPKRKMGHITFTGDVTNKIQALVRDVEGDHT